MEQGKKGNGPASSLLASPWESREGSIPLGCTKALDSRLGLLSHGSASHTCLTIRPDNWEDVEQGEEFRPQGLGGEIRGENWALRSSHWTSLGSQGRGNSGTSGAASDLEEVVLGSPAKP